MSNTSSSTQEQQATAVQSLVKSRLWAIQENGVWARWAPEFERWDRYSERRKFLAADPTTGEACFFINPDGSVHWRNVDKNENKSFPGILAKQISVGGDGRLWAIQENGIWARWVTEHGRWDSFSERREYLAADPKLGQACYFINPDGSVHWRNVDLDLNESFPGISAKQISVGGDNRLWAIQENDIWARWAPEYKRWEDTFSERRLFISADPTTGQACFFVNPDNSVHWRNIDQNKNIQFGSLSAIQISAGGQ